MKNAKTIFGKLFAVMLAIGITASMFAISASAAETVTVSSTEQLVAAIDNANNGNDVTIRLGSNLAGSGYTLGIKGKTAKVTFDLNGYQFIPNQPLPKTSDYYAFAVVGNSELTIIDSDNGQGVISSRGDTAIIVLQNGKLTVNGGNIYSAANGLAICGNGTATSASAVININGGTIGRANNDCAIYHPHPGTLNVNGGTILGKTGIEMRAGTLNVNGGSITGNNGDDGISFKSNLNGQTTYGAGIAVSQHTTNPPITVNINNGTVTGYIPLFEIDIQNGDSANVKLNVAGGRFNVDNNRNPVAPVAKAPIYSKKLTGFVTGGTYSSSIANSYIAAGYRYNAGRVERIPDTSSSTPGSSSTVNPPASSNQQPGSTSSVTILPPAEGRPSTPSTSNRPGNAGTTASDTSSDNTSTGSSPTDSSVDSSSGEDLPDSSAPLANNPKGDKDGGSLTWLWIVIAVVVVLAGIFFILLAKRRKDEEEEETVK